MAATTTTTSKFHPTKPTKLKRRRFKETTISTTAANHHHPPQQQQRKFIPPSVVSPDHSSWCCPASKPPHPPPPPPPPSPPPYASAPPTAVSLPSQSPSSPVNSKIRNSPSAVMDTANTTTTTQHETFPSSFTKFNSALTAGLLNPMSPPPQIDKTRSSPTLFEMMASEPDSKILQPSVVVSTHPKPQIAPIDKQALLQQRLSDLLCSRSPGNQFNDPSTSDVKLTLSSKDGVSVCMSVHRQILVGQSRFFAVKLSDRWKGQRNGNSNSHPWIIEIADCDEIEVYIETVRLMYCKDLRRKLMKEDVSKVLGILKVSAAIGFDAGVLSCLEYLEAAPWAEDEEEKVSSLLSELRLEGVGAVEVLKRVSVDVTNGVEESNDNEEVLLKLLQVVLEGKDEKARREMKGLVSKMLRENSSQNELRKESLYSACDGCLHLLKAQFLQAAGGDLLDVGQIARQADNLHWLLDILIDRQIAEEFLKTWASQSELSEAHSKVPVVHRYEISRVTARLFVGIGKGQLLASKDSRCLLLQTWLGPFYDDFGWMRRASRGLDRHLIEEGLSNTILTLPLAWQQDILMSWFDRFLNCGEDCPNIQRGFEVWWRRAFCRRNGEPERPRQFRIATATTENS